MSSWCTAKIDSRKETYMMKPGLEGVGQKPSFWNKLFNSVQSKVSKYFMISSNSAKIDRKLSTFMMKPSVLGECEKFCPSIKFVIL